ncbi:septal ring lytic transglycosylase RlpA family protein [Sphingosinicella rhizophila]|uniref:Endolytic peptidoglycan transglycosylase RlpA n=1 Tax=Sphingosinicella rhizophila TaxID=3050082 RepID=A0ABU3Q3H6_9SPHN|nr:septal ring lytic transglycosylase RlpA family protein [Sphingosinicella sp. GR2756]MDT9597867.1 septal ring lytic transglycosylase RlpA family protein [Sphingosinicella sp. GR2756]
MVEQLRRSGMRCVVALAAAGLMTSGPVQAVQIDQAKAAEVLLQSEALPQAEEPLVDVAEIVADLVDPPEAEPSYLHLADGEASYYGRELAGNRTASGERFDPHALTAAHRTLPMGTKLRVTNKSNGKSVIVRINDRGPFTRGRIIDVSLAAAREIQMIRSGKAMVRLEQLM